MYINYSKSFESWMKQIKLLGKQNKLNNKWNIYEIFGS